MDLVDGGLEVQINEPGTPSNNSPFFKSGRTSRCQIRIGMTDAPHQTLATSPAAHAPNNRAHGLSQKWTLAHDFAFVFGGAELVTAALAEHVVPSSEMIYLAGDGQVADQLAQDPKRILPASVTEKNFRYLLPWYPSIVGRRSPVEGNLLASSYSFCHHLQCTGTKVVYCHAPLRQAWNNAEIYADNTSVVESMATGAFGKFLRKRDLEASKSVKTFVATSRAVKRRIEKFYGRYDVPIIAPPVRMPSPIATATQSQRSGILWVGRITEPYKRLTLLIEAMNMLPELHLTVVGDGRDAPRIRSKSPSNVTFAGWVERETLHQYYSSAEALIFPSEDDFGISVIESLAMGTPVVAFRAGGALDNIVEGVNGLFFNNPNARELASSIRAAIGADWNYAGIHRSSREKFGEAHFAEQMKEILEKSVNE
ncbi:glycosyltransferase [Williamsia herbipolensis]|uniref:Glycosyltransferase n=1 Tax=Williamsia herbipolensis TaxID=1603258 RepID=A0AAU4K6W3_9NOCA|nr:glycosyltransferase [Williamsia herbipolensis]